MIQLLPLLLAGIVFLLGLLTYMGLAPVPTPSYSEVEVRVADASKATTTVVDARLATTYRQQYIGLSRTDSLGADEGMLFVFGSERVRTITMRAMDYPLDMIFVDGDGTVTAIETADPPEGLSGYFIQERRRAECAAVLEVNAGWAQQNNVAVGDTVEWNET